MVNFIKFAVLVALLCCLNIPSFIYPLKINVQANSNFVATGRFYVEGTNIIDPLGRVFIPIGANYNGANWVWTSDTKRLVDFTKNVWKFNTIRLVNCTDKPTCNGYRTYDNSDDIDGIIDAYTSQGIVVMLDLHDYTCKFTNDKELTEATQWWEDKAIKYKNNPYAWFNLFNEPGWSDPVFSNNANASPRWVEIHQPIIKKIRDDVGADNIIVADGTHCGQDARTWDDNPVPERNSAILTYGDLLKNFNSKSYGNIMFSVHTYDQWGSGGDNKLNNYLDRVKAKGHAIVIGETGYDKDLPQSTQSFGTMSTYRVAPSKGVGILVWHAQPGDRFSLVSETNGTIDTINSITNPTNLTRHGELMWGLTRTNNTNLPGPTSTGAILQSSSSSITSGSTTTSTPTTTASPTTTGGIISADSDGDGISNDIEYTCSIRTTSFILINTVAGGNDCDTDNDGIPDFQDTDSDNDGVPDAIERGPTGIPRDTNNDGIPDFRDPTVTGTLPRTGGIGIVIVVATIFVVFAFSTSLLSSKNKLVFNRFR